MAVLSLPTFEDPFYSYGTLLEGKPYILKFKFNQRESCWYLSIGLPDGTSLLAGIKIVCGVNLLWRGFDTRLPKGQLVAVTTGTNDEHPGLNDFAADKRVSLIYVTSDEPA